MCGRYTLYQIEQLQKRFDTENKIDVKPNYNAAPTQVMPIVTRNSPNKLELMKWGLVPFWAKDSRIGYKMINARSEGIQDKPSFRVALKSRRCLVPSTGFYEWKKVGDEKIPYFITLADRQLFAFAGLYEIWKDAEGRELKTYTIITTTPNDLMESIHDRMPVILNQEDESEWLDKEVTDAEQVTRLLKPYDNELMKAVTVSTDINRTANNNEKLILPSKTEMSEVGGRNSD